MVWVVPTLKVYCFPIFVSIKNLYSEKGRIRIRIKVGSRSVFRKRSDPDSCSEKGWIQIHIRKKFGSKSIFGKSSDPNTCLEYFGSGSVFGKKEVGSGLNIPPS